MRVYFQPSQAIETVSLTTGGKPSEASTRGSLARKPCPVGILETDFWGVVISKILQALLKACENVA